MSKPTQEEVEDLILSARFGELEDVTAFADKYGWDAVVDARDERGNSVLHMICGNGHLDVLNGIIAHLPPAALTAVNEAGTPPLHWAVLNNHTVVVQALVDVPEEKGGGIQLLKQKSTVGRDALAEAIFAGEGKEEVAGWIEGYIWKKEGGDDEDFAVSAGVTDGPADESDAAVEVTEAVVAKDDADAEVKKVAERTEGLTV